MTTREFQGRLVRRCRKAGVSIGDELALRLEAYYRLLAKWNDKINLSGLQLVDPAPETIDRLLIEPLVAAKYIPGSTQSLIDIGSGGGSPAVPMALAAGVRLSMVESKTRKSVFLREVLRELKMDDSAVFNHRFEALLARPDLHEAFDVLSIRAVRLEPSVLNGIQAFVRGGGLLLLFRSAATPRQENPAPPLGWLATHTLLESLQSQVVVLSKRLPASVPRGTLRLDQPIRTS